MSASDQPGNAAKPRPGAPAGPAQPGGPDRKIVPSPWQPPAEVDPVPPGLGNDTPPG